MIGVGTHSDRRGERRWHVAVMSGHSTKGRWRISGKTNAVAIMGGCDMDLRKAEIDGAFPGLLDTVLKLTPA